MAARVCVIGVGRSGAVAAACLAELGHAVRAVDVDAGRIARFAGGKPPFHEPGLDDLVTRNLKAGRLSFTTDLAQGVPEAQYVLLALPTPARDDGRADLTSIDAAVRALAPLLSSGAIVVTRSTVPVGTNAAIARTVCAQRPEADIHVVANPEFLREGRAVQDFLEPERVVIGANSKDIAQRAAALYEGLDCPIVLTDLPTAELAKYAANAYLAASVSFINEIASISERASADIEVVARVLALDQRIGPHAYLTPGLGFGGACLPKDLSALINAAEELAYEPALLRAVHEVNAMQPERTLARLREALGGLDGRTVLILGLSFKGDTFDLRSAPAVALARLLVRAGGRVRAFEPLADGSADGALPPDVELYSDPYEAARGAHAAVLAADHHAFRGLDLARLRRAMAPSARGPMLLDARSFFAAHDVERAGFTYLAIGRPFSFRRRT